MPFFIISSYSVLYNKEDVSTGIFVLTLFENIDLVEHEHLIRFGHLRIPTAYLQMLRYSGLVWVITVFIQIIWLLGTPSNSFSHWYAQFCKRHICVVCLTRTSAVAFHKLQNKWNEIQRKRSIHSTKFASGAGARLDVQVSIDVHSPSMVSWYIRFGLGWTSLYTSLKVCSLSMLG